MLKIILFFPLFLFSLEKLPWFGEVYQFHFFGAYTYSFYSKVEDALIPLAKTSNDNLLYFALDFPYSSKWSIDTDLQFASSPRLSFRFRTVALQLRQLFLDDMIGDPCSLSLSFSGRYVSPKSLHDISCPYHGEAEGEALLSIGKEIDAIDPVLFRLWLFGGLGMANKGSPWLEGGLGVDANIQDTHKIGVSLETGHGYGRETFVDIEDFNGYGRERYQFLDLSVRYGIHGCWGTLRAMYTYRLLAECYPENYQAFTISYLLPFSF